MTPIDRLILTIKEANRRYDDGEITSAELQAISGEVSKEFERLEREEYGGNEILQQILPLLS